MDLDLRFTAASILAGYAVVAMLERSQALRLRESKFWRRFFATDVGWYLSAVAVTLAFAPFFEALAVRRAALGLPGLETLDIPWWAHVALATVLYDLGTTAAHRLLHHSDVLWRFHKVHHSSRVLDWLATTRAHALEHLARGIPTQALLFLLGTPASAVAAAIALYAAFATLGHSNLRLPLSRLEWLFVTPRIHHLHHVPETTHRNFGTVFTLWDRALGSFVGGKANEDEVLGVPGEVESYPQTWHHQWLEPFRR